MSRVYHPVDHPGDLPGLPEPLPHPVVDNHAHLDLAARFDLLATAVGEVDCSLRPDERPTHRHFSPGLIQF